MRLVGRLVLMAFVLPLAIVCGSFFLVFAAFFDPTTAAFVADTFWFGFSALIETAARFEDPRMVEDAFFGAGRLALAILVAPPVFVALVAEVAGFRRFAWHVGATALLTGAMPWLLSGAARQPTPEEVGISIALALSGAVTGFIYWLLCGHGAGARPTVKTIAPSTSPGS